MSKDPAFLFYPNDYLGGTMGMNFEEKGAYVELLMMQFNRGHMTDHMIGQTVGQLWDKLKDKFIQDDNGLWFNERLDAEKFKRQNFTKSRRNNVSGRNQYNKSSEKNGKDKAHMNGHMTEHMENENENENINNNNKVLFSSFWDLYDKKVDRVKCQAKWDKLKFQEQIECLQKIPEYLKATPDKKFRRDPETYLNNKSWENEIIIQNTNKKLQHELSTDF